MKSAASSLIPRHRPKRFSKLVWFIGTSREIQKTMVKLLNLSNENGYVIESATRSNHYKIKGKIIENNLGNLVLVHFAKGTKQEMFPCWNLMAGQVSKLAYPPRERR